MKFKKLTSGLVAIAMLLCVAPAFRAATIRVEEFANLIENGEFGTIDRYDYNAKRVALESVRNEATASLRAGNVDDMRTQLRHMWEQRHTQSFQFVEREFNYIFTVSSCWGEIVGNFHNASVAYDRLDEMHNPTDHVPLLDRVPQEMVLQWTDILQASQDNDRGEISEEQPDDESEEEEAEEEDEDNF